MSTFRNAHVSQNKFANLPSLGPDIPEYIHDASEGASSISADSTSSRRAERLLEGDMVTGAVDLANDRVYWIPPIRETGRVEEKAALERYLISLAIVPPNFTLDDESNTAWLELLLHRHHDLYATIAFAPSRQYSQAILSRLAYDNGRRQGAVDYGHKDPGRSTTTNWFEGLDESYSLIILHPSHFLIDDRPIMIKNRDTRSFEAFYSSPEGLLRNDSTELDSFTLLNPRDVPLNPLLVNFAAAIRFRRFKYRPTPSVDVRHSAVSSVIESVEELQDAILFTPTPRPTVTTPTTSASIVGSGQSHPATTLYPLSGPFTLDPSFTNSNLVSSKEPSGHHWEDSCPKWVLDMITPDFVELPDLDYEDKHGDGDRKELDERLQKVIGTASGSERLDGWLESQDT